jgi:hypothetical protein
MGLMQLCIRNIADKLWPWTASIPNRPNINVRSVAPGHRCVLPTHDGEIVNAAGSELHTDDIADVAFKAVIEPANPDSDGPELLPYAQAPDYSFVTSLHTLTELCYPDRAI